MKRLLCGVLALMLLMLGTCTPALAEKLVDSGDVGTIHWELDSKGKLTVTGTGIIEKIPAVDAYAKKIKVLEIGDGITGITCEAFSYLRALTKITFGKDVQVIESGAFFDCTKVQSITFTGCGDIDSFSFMGDMHSVKLKEVTYPEGAPIVVKDSMVMSADGQHVYQYLGSTSKLLYLPSGVVSAPGAFCGQKMKEVVIPASFQWFGGSEFRDCKQLASVVFLDISSPVHWGDSGMVFTSCNMASLTLPPMLADYDVAANFITSCKKLKLVAFGEGTDQLLSNTISDCAALEKVYLPQSLTVIAEDAIGYTPKLTLMVREGSYAETFAKEQGFKYAYFTPVSVITLSEQALTLKKGKSVTLTAEIAPADATEQTLIWCSSDPKVATVTKGKVKAVGVGSCEIICYASDGSNARTVCSLTVEK